MENEEIKKLRESIIEACHMVGKLRCENDHLKAKLDAASDAIRLLAERPDEKCGVCKFKNACCMDCSFVYEHEDWFID